MSRKLPYWVGARPSGAKRWAGAESGAVLDNDIYRNQIFAAYRRYVKQWNDIELDHNRSLSEHTHEICGAKVVGSPNQFILHGGQDRHERWILEVVFTKGFKQYYPGLSTGLNTLRTVSDIKSIRLHWSQEGEKAFNAWLALERETNLSKGEWSEYKS